MGGLEINFEEEGRILKRRVDALPEKLTYSHLKKDLDYLFLYPYIRRIYFLELAQKKILNEQELEQLKKLNGVSSEYYIENSSGIFGRKRTLSYPGMSLEIRERELKNEEVSIYRDDEEKLRENLSPRRIDTCWSHRKDEAKIICKNMVRDVNLGGSVLLFNHKDGHPKSFVRNFIVKDNKKETLLFIDTIETGNVDWNKIEDWEKKKRTEELLLNVAASSFIARYLDINSLVMAEEETTQLAKKIGCRGSKPFGKNRKSCKIGLIADDYRGVYSWRLRGTEKFYVLDLGLDSSLREPKDIGDKRVSDAYNDLMEAQRTLSEW